jgi:hypothetical protein
MNQCPPSSAHSAARGIRDDFVPELNSLFVVRCAPVGFGRNYFRESLPL